MAIQPAISQHVHTCHQMALQMWLSALPVWNSYCSHFMATKTKAKRDQGLVPDYTLSNLVQIQTSHLQTPLTLTGSKIVRFCITCLCECIRKDIFFDLLYLLILCCSDFFVILMFLQC